MAGFAQERPEAARIALCDARIEIGAGHDAEMERFNDYVAIVTVIEALGTVYTFDPGLEEFVNLPD